MLEGGVLTPPPPLTIAHWVNPPSVHVTMAAHLISHITNLLNKKKQCKNLLKLPAI